MKRENMENMISIKWIGVGAVFYFYGAMLKSEIIQTAHQQRLHFNNWDVSLRLLTDPYLILYFVVPIALLFFIKSIVIDFDYQILIRLGSFKKWIYYSFKNFWRMAFPLLFLWGFMSLFMAIGFPHSWEWSEVSKIASSTNTLDKLVYFFHKPIFAFIAQLLLLLFTFSLLHIAFAIIYVLTKKKNLILFLSVFFFLYSGIGFKLLPTKFAFLSPVCFLSITNGVRAFHSPLPIFSIVIIFLVVCIWFLKFLDLNKKIYIHSIKSSMPIVAYFSICVMGIGATARSLAQSSAVTIWDVFAMSFIGVSADRFAYIPFFFYSVVFFGLVYLIQLLFLSNEIEQLGYYKIIRFKSLRKWFWSWMTKLMAISGYFLFILIILSLALAVCFGANVGFSLTLLPNPLHEVIYHFLVNGFLQVIFYISLVFIFSWINKESIYGVVLTSILMLLMLPGINSKGIIPVGLNSIIYLEDDSPYYLTLILVAANVISYSIIDYLLKQSVKI
ncbi:hypothetical protein ACPVTF_04615 [Geobacillus icigianus]|nr:MULTISPECIES: hypothetical protein [Geobacillus]KYD28625.1 hypothetical protein B4113_3422 [Geobacillus sp. B4113_201601]